MEFLPSLESIGRLLGPTALVFLMFVMGVELAPRDFRAIAANPRAAIVALACIYFGLPVIGLLLAITVAPTSAVIALGIVLIIACPSGAFSNFFTYIVKANVALSVALSAVTNLLAVLTVPLIIAIGFALVTDASARIALSVPAMLQQLTLTVFVPIIFGMLLRSKAPDFASRISGPLRRFSTLLFGTLIVLVTTANWDVVVEHFAFATPVLLGLASATVLLGWLVATAAKLNDTDRFTVSAEVGIQNIALANVIAINLLARSDLAVAPAIYALVCVVPVGAAAILMHRQRRGLPSRSDATKVNAKASHPTESRH